MNEYEILRTDSSLRIADEIDQWAAKGWKLHTFQVIGKPDSTRDKKYDTVSGIDEIVEENRRFYAVMEKECENESS